MSRRSTDPSRALIQTQEERLAEAFETYPMWRAAVDATSIYRWWVLAGVATLVTSFVLLITAEELLAEVAIALLSLSIPVLPIAYAYVVSNHYKNVREARRATIIQELGVDRTGATQKAAIPFMTRFKVRLQILWDVNKPMLISALALTGLLFGGLFALILSSGDSQDLEILAFILAILLFFGVAASGLLLFKDILLPNKEMQERLVTELHIRQLRMEHHDLTGAMSLSSGSSHDQMGGALSPATDRGALSQADTSSSEDHVM